MRKHQTPKGKKAAKRRPDPDRLADGRFKTGNKAGTASKQNHVTHGLADAKRLLKAAGLHGSRARHLQRVFVGPQPLAQALQRRLQELAQEVGGPKGMTGSAWMLARRLVISEMIMESLDDFAVARHPANKRSRRSYPITLERMKIISAYAEHHKAFREMVQAKQARETTDLNTYLAQKASDGKATQD